MSSERKSQMRNLVQPPPSQHCDLCDGELRLKLIKPVDPGLDLDAEIFVCAKCGNEQSYVVYHDNYAAHTASNMPTAKLGKPDGSRPT
jgi:hypothetical protein